MTYRVMWPRRSVRPVDLVSGVRGYGAALIVAGLVLPIAAGAEAADSTSPGTFTGPALTAGSATAGPVDVNFDGSGTGVVGRYPQEWLHIAEAISFSPNQYGVGLDGRQSAPSHGWYGFFAQFELISEALDKFGSSF